LAVYGKGSLIKVGAAVVHMLQRTRRRTKSVVRGVTLNMSTKHVVVGLCAAAVLVAMVVLNGRFNRRSAIAATGRPASGFEVTADLKPLTNALSTGTNTTHK
jgi:hypothetical protein